MNLKTGTERYLCTGDWCVRGQEKVKWALGEQDEVNVVRSIFDDRIDRKPYVVIAQRLNRLRIPCPQRGRWRNKDQKWSGGTVKAIIDNPAYYGARAYNRNSMSKILAQQKGIDLKDSTRYPHWLNGEEE